MSDRRKVEVQWCGDYCGSPHCRKYWLTRVGSFYQGSGFSKKEAERIAELINADEDFPFDE